MTKVSPEELVGLAEIAAMFGVARNSAWRWSRLEGFRGTPRQAAPRDSPSGVDRTSSDGTAGASSTAAAGLRKPLTDEHSVTASPANPVLRAA